MSVFTSKLFWRVRGECISVLAADLQYVRPHTFSSQSCHAEWSVPQNDTFRARARAAARHGRIRRSASARHLLLLARRRAAGMDDAANPPRRRLAMAHARDAAVGAQRLCFCLPHRAHFHGPRAELGPRQLEDARRRAPARVQDAPRVHAHQRVGRLGRSRVLGAHRLSADVRAAGGRDQPDRAHDALLCALGLLPPRRRRDGLALEPLLLVDRRVPQPDALDRVRLLGVGARLAIPPRHQPPPYALPLHPCRGTVAALAFDRSCACRSWR